LSAIEHQAPFPDTAERGKHRYVTLQRTPAPYAVPTGTDYALSQQFSAPTLKPYLQVQNSAGTIWFVPLRRQIFGVNVGGAAGLHNLFDFAGLPGNSGGTIQVIDSQGADWGRQVFCMFAFIAGVLHIPTQPATPPPGNPLTTYPAQLAPGGGGTFRSLTSNGGSILQLETMVALPNPHTVIVLITESFI
jgi:hypothetical protein